MYYLKILYHKFMIWYYGWKTKRLVKKMRKLGKERGLPPLDQWTDEQVIKGLAMYKNYENN